jgi:glutaconate CoA-transferase subunit A
VQGYYGRDHAAFGDYHNLTRSRDGFLEWLDEWILKMADHEQYLLKVGSRFEDLRPLEQRLAAAVDYA